MLSRNNSLVIALASTLVQAFDPCQFAPMMDLAFMTASKKSLSAMTIVSPTSGRLMGSSHDDFDLIEGGYNVVVTNPTLFRSGLPVR